MSISSVIRVACASCQMETSIGSLRCSDRAGRVGCKRELGAGWPCRRVLHLLFDREHDHYGPFDSEKNGVGKAMRQGAMDPDCDLRK